MVASTGSATDGFRSLTVSSPSTLATSSSEVAIAAIFTISPPNFLHFSTVFRAHHLTVSRQRNDSNGSSWCHIQCKPSEAFCRSLSEASISRSRNAAPASTAAVGFSPGLFPSPVAVINDPAGGHERGVRGREQSSISSILSGHLSSLISAICIRGSLLSSRFIISSRVRFCIVVQIIN